MDLSTVKNKIHNVYRRVEEAIQDLRLIWKNCFEFNAEGSEICDAASSMAQATESLIEVTIRWQTLLYPECGFLSIYLSALCLFISVNT
jgi:hypothetical protein